jgi:gliding motility-associated-like protein
VDIAYIFNQMLQLSKILIFTLFLLFSLSSKAQFCTGSTSEPNKVDFDRGEDNYGDPIYDNTTYSYIAGNPAYAGGYSIVKSTGAFGNSFGGVLNNTPNDSDGYMMVVNPGRTPGVFYQRYIDNLCPNSQYEFSICVNSMDGKTNLNFSLEVDENLIKESRTEEISSTLTNKWVKYSVVFTSPPNVETDGLLLKISTLYAGVPGNLFAIDDINFITCGPQLTAQITNPDNNNAYEAGICAGESKTYTFKANVAPGFVNYKAIWQQNTGNGWEDIPNANSADYTVNFINPEKGKYQYRFSASEEEKFSSMGCRIVSMPIVINVSDKPRPTAINSGTQCVGKDVQLFASDSDSFIWNGPNGFTSTEKNPVLKNVSLADAGIYTVTGFVNNCQNTAQTTVNIVASVVANTNINYAKICEEDNIQLVATGGTIYSWTPIDGLSDPNIANPIATPKITTTYRVKVSSGECSDTKDVLIEVLKSTATDAGKDQKILTGESFQLNGKVTGTDGDIKYYWTPIDYLDDPSKLNPIATPPTDITYTLHSESAFGCGNSSDNVTITVIPKIIIPNFFSPNGDGENDLWEIPSSKSFADTKLIISNRYGKIVHQSKGYIKPWDGKFKEKDLPSGTYYYVINLGNNTVSYTGWIFLLR